MFKSKLKNGFTLAEMMIVLVIMSIIIFITLVSQKPFDRGVSALYQRAYRSLALAAYNINLDLTEANPVFPIANPQAMCYALATTDPTKNFGKSGYLNAASNMINCDSISATNGVSSVPLTANDSDFQPGKVLFTTVNGMKFYIATHNDVDPEKDGYLKDVTIGTRTDTIQYCVIFVDLNGDKPPNTATWTEKAPADIVAFAVTESGETIPIGYPEVDKRYLTLSVHYPDGALANQINRYSSAMTFYEAKWDAWGNVQHPDIMESVDFITGNTDFNGSKLIIPSYAPFTHPAVHTTTYGCQLNTQALVSPCEVDLNQYY